MAQSSNLFRLIYISLMSMSLSFSASAQWSTEDPQTSTEGSRSTKSPLAPNESKQRADNKSEETISSKTTTTRRVIRNQKKSRFEELGASLILSVDVGLLFGFPSSKLKDYGAKSGLSIEGKALGSVLLKKYLIDAGLGWFSYGVSGDEPQFSDGQKLIYEDGRTVIDNTSIKLSGAILEASPSYRITKSWFAGPTVQFRFPSDLGYTSTVARSALGVYLGGQGGYQIFDEDLNTRFVGRVMMPLNYKDWLGLFVVAGVQIGLPFTQPESLTIKESTITTSEKKIVEYKKQVYSFKVTRDVFKLVLDNLVVFYPEPGYPTITTESQSFLIDLAQSLTQNDGNWGSLQVDTVSKDHGQVTRDAMVSAGISERKVRVGAVLPGDKLSATPPVEFTFKGVKNQGQMMDAVRRAMKSMSIPETCGEDGKCN